MYKFNNIQLGYLIFKFSLLIYQVKILKFNLFDINHIIIPHNITL